MPLQMWFFWIAYCILSFWEWSWICHVVNLDFQQWVAAQCQASGTDSSGPACINPGTAQLDFVLLTALSTSAFQMMSQTQSQVTQKHKWNGFASFYDGLERCRGNFRMGKTHRPCCRRQKISKMYWGVNSLMGLLVVGYKEWGKSGLIGKSV